MIYYIYVVDINMTIAQADADTVYFSPSLYGGTSGGLFIEVHGGPDGKMSKLDGSTFYAVPTYSDGKIGSWRLGGPLAEQLGLSN